MLTFSPIADYPAGILASLLTQSYAELLSAEPQIWAAEKENWLRFDREVFDHPEIIGRCVFVSSWEGQTIGFGSFDPRGRPALGVIGHNCILPEFRGHGFGNRQILEIIERFRRRGILKARVTTSEHPFFLPARKMYLSCGFEESVRHSGGPDPRFRLIDYRRRV